MNCSNHPEALASAFCRECGKALCNECQHPSSGTMYCQQHAPAPATPPHAAPSPAPVAVPDAPSPGLAFLLGLIPGVGAIYNAQYAKGLVHVIIWGLLISIVNSDAAGGLEPLFGMMIAVWHFYMAFEAYHTAKKRLAGVPVDEYSSLVPLKGRSAGFPVLPIVLIAVGTAFLLNNLEIVRLYQIIRYWPVFLIVLGVYLLYLRVAGDEAAVPADREAANERQ